MLPSLISALILSQPNAKLEADQALAKFRTEHAIVGLSAAVFTGNKLVYSGSAGFADREQGKPATDKTWFRLGSISKPVTAVGAMILVQGGRLDLDADCRTYIPEWPADRPKATVRQFLSHTSGVRHYQPVGDPDGKMYYPTAAGAVGIFIKDPLRFPPGRQYSYSTHAYTLVARAMESVVQMPFPDWMRKEVFPFGKGGLDVEILTEKKDRSALYAPSGSEVKVQFPREDNSWKFAGGGMEATAPGLGMFFNNLVQVQILNNESMRQMWSSTRLNDGLFSNYGLGFRLLKGGIVGHNGAQQGCRTAMLLDLNRQSVAVVLTNTEGTWDPSDLAETLLNLAPRLAAK